MIMPERVTIKRVRIPFAESLRFPGEGKSAQGESDPKTRPKGVVDGNAVNIRQPVGGDEFQKLFPVTGFREQRRSSRK